MASETFMNEYGHEVTIRVSRDLALPGIVSVTMSAASGGDTIELAFTPLELTKLRELIVRQSKEARRHDRQAQTAASPPAP